MFEESRMSLYELSKLTAMFVDDDIGVENEASQAFSFEQRVDDLMGSGNKRMNGDGIAVHKPQLDRGAQLALGGIQFGDFDRGFGHG